MAIRNEALINWVQSNYGNKGDKFQSASAWAKAAQINRHGVSQIISEGRASEKVTVALARAAGLDVLEALEIQGLITPEDYPRIQLAGSERRLIKSFRSLAEHNQSAVLSVCQSLHGNNEDSESSSQEVVQNKEH